MRTLVILTLLSLTVGCAHLGNNPSSRRTPSSEVFSYPKNVAKGVAEFYTRTGVRLRDGQRRALHNPVK